MLNTECGLEGEVTLKISVVMAAYNSQATIAKSIESFLIQDHLDKELLVIDGASKDNTRNIVEGFRSPLIKIFSEPDKGIYDAMNKGLRLVSGDAFGCLNSDDCYARSDSLSIIARALETADIVSGRLNFVREHDGMAPVRVWVPKPHKHGAYARGYSLPHPSTYAKRSVLKRVGEFRTDYGSAGDYDWLMRALELEGFSHTVVDQALVNMRLGGDSTAGVKALWRNSKGLLKVRQDRLGSGYIDLAAFLNIAAKIRQLRMR